MNQMCHRKPSLTYDASDCKIYQIKSIRKTFHSCCVRIYLTKYFLWETTPVSCLNKTQLFKQRVPRDLSIMNDSSYNSLCSKQTSAFLFIKWK
ncbi:Uncharacterized protein APZ42_014967 [Daphnia magna]|uniref:Uncharacterized protein n=1 Tax=Daphnia magna TaxID=35525 RepID=A0A0P6ALZ7_9CRUS|nr:Uncharacterized protein APZ42_014967 [Daphnia magna]